MTIESVFLAIAGGFLPALIWLFFWLKEDESPEPKHLIFIAFVGGMLAIPLALAVEWLWNSLLSVLMDKQFFAVFFGFSMLIGFALIEEYSKYLVTSSLIFWRRDYNEPADAMIYLITGALGFAAVENVLYLVGPFGTDFMSGFEISNLRFIGATLLHAMSSAVLGYFIAGSFFRDKIRKEVAVVLGLTFATALHALFNLLILITGGVYIEPALVLLVIVGIFILFAFERVKHKIKQYYAKG